MIIYQIGGNKGLMNNIDNSNIGTHGTPDGIVDQLVKSLREQITFLREIIIERDRNIEQMENTIAELIESKRLLNEEHKKLVTVIDKKLDEIHENTFPVKPFLSQSRELYIEGISEIFDYIKKHDKGCKANHAFLRENSKKKKMNQILID